MKTRRRPLRVVGLLAALAVVAAGYVALAPTSIGGSTIYSFTYGTSMQPKLHKGDLIVVRTTTTPRVGDVVLYVNGDLKRHVLHRIIRLDGKRFVLKGDNNAFIDTYEPTRSEILGGLWFKVGGVGNGSSWLREPAHSAIVAGIVALLSLLGGGVKAERKRRRRTAAATSSAWLAAQRGRSTVASGGGSGQGGLVPGQTAQAVAGVLGLIALACGVLALVAFTRSTTKLGAGPAQYSQTGAFSYSAKVPPGAVYENGILSTGQPAYVQVVRSLDLRFDWKLETQLPHTTFGTTGLIVVMANGSGWTRTFRLASAQPFTGDTASVHGILRLSDLRKLADRLEAVTGQVPDTYTITVRPTVQLHGAIGGVSVKEVFAPALALPLDRYKLTLPSPDGTDTALQRTQDGPPTTQRVTRAISVLGVQLQVQSARRLSAVVGLASLAGALAIGILFLLGLRRADAPERIRARFGHLIVEIVEPRRRFAEHDVTMASFEDLVRVSDRHARMILHAQEGYRHIYLVEDDGVAYRFEVHGRSDRRSSGTTLWRGTPPAPDGGDTGGDIPAGDAPSSSARR